MTEQRSSQSEDGRVAALQLEIDALRAVIRSVEQSRSWRLTAPLRVIASRLRSSAARRLLRRASHARLRDRHLRTGAFPTVAVGSARGSVCAIVHVFYAELADEIASRLARCEQLAVVLVTHPPQVSATTIESSFSHLRARGIAVECVCVANRGRDVLPLVTVAQRALDTQCEVFVKLHTKRSPHLGEAGNAWRTSLLDGLLPGSRQIADLVTYIATDENFGFAVPAEHAAGRVHWGANRKQVRTLARRARVRVPRRLVFPAGNMYWCSRGWLECFVGLGLVAEDFEPETGQVDATLAHAAERLIGCFAWTKRATIWLLPDP